MKPFENNIFLRVFNFFDNIFIFTNSNIFYQKKKKILCAILKKLSSRDDQFELILRIPGLQTWDVQTTFFFCYGAFVVCELDICQFNIERLLLLVRKYFVQKWYSFIIKCFELWSIDSRDYFFKNSFLCWKIFFLINNGLKNHFKYSWPNMSSFT